MAFEVWLEHRSERKKPPEQLPIVLQVNPMNLEVIILSPSKIITDKFCMLFCVMYLIVQFRHAIGHRFLLCTDLFWYSSYCELALNEKYIHKVYE